MRDLLRPWREHGWFEVSADVYSQIWQRFGGSVMTHPDIVEKLSELTGIPVRYLGTPAGSDYRGAIATWGPYLALSRQALKRAGKRDYFDLGNAEIILPIAEGSPIPVRYRMRYVSQLNARTVCSLKPQNESIALARPPEEYSKKFLYNQRRELRLFEASGGSVKPALSFSADELAAMYTDLFRKRWGFEVPAGKNLAAAFTLMRPFMFGSVLCHDGKAIALQVLYRVESPAWISVEYINGGVDPTYKDFSPGSVLTYLNTQEAWGQARAGGKPLRYSFGRADRDYKLRWCHTVPVYRT